MRGRDRTGSRLDREYKLPINLFKMPRRQASSVRLRTDAGHPRAARERVGDTSVVDSGLCSHLAYSNHINTPNGCRRECERLEFECLDELC